MPWSFNFPYLSLGHTTVEGLSTSFILWDLAAVLVTIYLFKSRSSRPLPPGPRPWPIIGNVLQIPKEKEWLKYMEWSNKYGDIISLKVFGRTLIILNSSNAAVDLLQKRSFIYSDRPHFTFGGEIVGWDMSLALTHYGEHFRQMRRLTQQIFSRQPARQFWGAQEQEAAKFLNRLLETPEKFPDHIRHTVGAVVLKISHGYTVAENGKDPMVAHAEQTMDEFSRATTLGAFLVDFLPWLKYIPSWFPGAEFQRTAILWRKNVLRMADSAHNFTKDQMAKGTAIPSFSSRFLEGDYTAQTESLVKWTALSIYGAGADTSVSAIKNFFLAMCLHPEVQIIAQAELDAVIGPDKLPTMEDRPSLPYIESILKEVLRWGAIVPGGLPHRLMKEDVYNGYTFPAGSILISNIWAMTHNPDVFPQPDEFRPGRFFGPSQETDVDPLQLIFGFGRRVCAGQHLAESSLFIAIAMTLATFSISKARDADSGKILEPTAAWLPGVISHPVPFRCEIKPRSSRSAELIKRTVAAGKE